MRNPLHIPDYYSPVNVNESYLTFILYIILPTTLLNVIMITLIRGIHYQFPPNYQTIILSLSEEMRIVLPPIWMLNNLITDYILVKLRVIV